MQARYKCSKRTITGALLGVQLWTSNHLYLHIFFNIMTFKLKIVIIKVTYIQFVNHFWSELPIKHFHCDKRNDLVMVNILTLKLKQT